MSDTQLREKFADCAKFAVRPVKAEALADLLWNLERLPDIAIATASC
jgi:hypothetical protein